MNISTKFDIGQKVRRIGTLDIGRVTEISITITGDGESVTVYEHAAADNPYVGADFGGDGFESEFEAL